MKDNKNHDKYKYFVGMSDEYIIIDNDYNHIIEEANKVDKKFKIKSTKTYDKAIDYLVRHMTDIDLIRFGLFYNMNPKVGKLIKANPDYENTKEYKELVEAYNEVNRYYDNVLKIEKDIHHKKIFGNSDNENEDVFDIFKTNKISNKNSNYIIELKFN